MTPVERQRVLVLEADQEGWLDFYRTVAAFGEVSFFSTLRDLLDEEASCANPLLLLDVGCLHATNGVEQYRLQETRRHRRIGLVTDMVLEQYIGDLRHLLGLFQILVKTDPIDLGDLRHFVQCLENPLNGFGLTNYMQHTCEMHRREARTLPDKHNVINDVMDHFATNGYDIHRLYDVRLVLEELLNNAYFHAYRTAGNVEKYRISDFRELLPEETVHVEFGSTSHLAGFTVSDAAGTLPLATVLYKLERQLNRDGLFDESGRGLYLTRILSSVCVVDIEEGRRTQIVALFDEAGRQREPKPFIINYVGKAPFPELLLDPELD